MENDNRNDYYKGYEEPAEEMPISPEEMPPVDSFEGLFSEQIEENKNRTPEKMFITPKRQLAHLGLMTAACYLGLCLITLLFCRHLWIEMNGPGLMISKPTSIIFGLLVLAMMGLVGYYVIHGILHRSETHLANIFMTFSFGLICFVSAGISYIFVPSSKLLFILITAGIIALGVFFIKKIKEPEYSLNVIVLGAFFIIYLIFAVVRVFFVPVLYNGYDFSVDYYYVQSDDAVGMVEPDHVKQCDSIYVYDDVFKMSTLDDVDFNKIAFENETGVDNYFDKRIAYLDEIGDHNPETRAIEKAARELLEPELQKYDSEFFRDNLIWMIPVYYNNKISGADFSNMYAIQGNLNILPEGHVISDDRVDGICFMLIKMSKQRVKLLSISSINAELRIQS